MKRRWHWLLLPALLAALAMGAQTWAAGGGYTLLRGVADQSSVLTVQDSTYQLQGSVGQPFAGASTTGQTWIGAEYWYTLSAPLSPGQRVYLPLTKR